MIGLIGLSLSLLLYRVAFPPGTAKDPRLFLGLFAAHVFAAIVYWQYSLQNPADSHLYYTDFLKWSYQDWKSGTIFLIKSVQWMRVVFGGSYLEYFVLFQVFGLAGISLLARSMYEITADLDVRLTKPMIGLLFLPGLHFWTCSIGKDAPLFFAAALAAWAMIRIERRFLAFGLAVAIMLPIRPHIAAVSAVALAAALLFDRRIQLTFKIPLGLVAIAGALWVVTSAQQSLAISSLSADGLGEFIASKQEYGSRTSEGATLANLPVPLKVASLLFRPFFFDANGFFGLAVSFENLILLLIVGWLAFNARTVGQLATAVPYIRYCLIVSAVLTILLSLVTYNVGLGLRQKFMIMPSLLLMFASLLAYHEARKAERKSIAERKTLTPATAAFPPR